MDQTLGKRIATLRKNAGMTQDALAEQLGLTAQAVSKWENDQSCPDITVLPKLAEIFGVTTDELLGCRKDESAPPVHQAEVVTPEDEEDDDESGHGWSVKYETGRQGSILFAVLVLLVGLLTLASRLLSWDVSFWEILWPSALLVFGINGMVPRFSAFNLGMTLCGGYFLLDNLGLINLDLGSEIIFPVLIIIFGISLLIDAMRQPKKPVFKIFHDGKRIHRGDKPAVNNYTTDGDRFSYTLSFAENTQLIDLPILSGGDINVSFGELTMDLSGCEHIADGCRLDASVSFGQLNLLVPRKYRVKHEAGAAFGAVEISGHPDPDAAATIQLNGRVSFGEIEIHYI